MPDKCYGSTAVSKTVSGGSTPSSGAIFIEVSSSGRTAGFDPAYRGSNPCTSAKLGDLQACLTGSSYQCKGFSVSVALID